MTEFVCNIFVQTCVAVLAFFAGAMWMRDNYLPVIKQMKQKIIELQGNHHAS